MVLCTYLDKSFWSYLQDNIVDPSKQTNIAFLREASENLTHMPVEPRFVKQRSEVWFELRKKARVTGSTLHSAIGLRGLKEQKNHFSNFFDGVDVPFTPDTESRMQHGVMNEINAVASLIGRFLSAYFPHGIFTEEGCYIIPGNTHDILSVVSPDGSIRSSLEASEGLEQTVLAAVEIKCPFPSDRQTPVHYSLPEYYVCQCLAEMAVLKTEQLLYVTYSENSTTILRVKFSNELWEMIWNETTELYDNETLKRPTKCRPITKEIKEKVKNFTMTNVEFLCEIPSCKMSVNINLPCLADNNHYMKAEDRNKTWYEDVVFDSSDTDRIMNQSKSVIECGYNLFRQKATEVMIWVITNKNRNSTSEIPCSVPIAYGLKDYKLNSESMRKATDHVLKECTSYGLNILSFATDGQWIKLMSRDSQDQPLTIFQLQKDTWNKTKSLLKQELIKLFDEIVKIDKEDYFRTVCMLKLDCGKIYVSSMNSSLSRIQTTHDKELWLQNRKKNKERNKPTDIDQDEGNRWLPEAVLNDLANDDADNQLQIQSVITEVSAEMMQSLESMDTGSNEQSDNFDANLLDVEICYHQPPQDCNSDLAISIENTPSAQQEAENEDVEENEHTCLLNVNEMINRLREIDSKSLLWVDCTTEKLADVLRTLNGVKTLGHCDMNVIYGCIEKLLDEKYRLFKKSWKKEQKVNFLGGILGLTELMTKKPKKMRKRNPISLRKLSIQVLQSKKYPKTVLSAAYASYIFHDELAKWQEQFPFKCPMAINDSNEVIPFWFSYPERSDASGDWLCKSIDCSHNLTHLRVLTSTRGISGISSSGWKECAKSNETLLTIPIVDDLIDKQSVANARTHFSQDVEEWMRNNGFLESAELTKLIREWYSACDDPGIPAVLRINKLVAMRKFLLDGIDFCRFPPAGRYFKGIPVVTFEGMLIDIDSKLQLHALTDTYNIRSVGSLAAETTVGLLQTLYPTTQVSIKARDVPSLMSSVVEVMTCKSNSKRGFLMRTSRYSGVYPDHEADSSMTIPKRPGLLIPEMLSITPRDHDFDLPRKKKSKRKIKFGKVSGPSAPSKGALPVRQFHKTDESKILPTKRIGIASDCV